MKFDNEHKLAGLEMLMIIDVFWQFQGKL